MMLYSRLARVGNRQNGGTDKLSIFYYVLHVIKAILWSLPHKYQMFILSKSAKRKINKQILLYTNEISVYVDI